MNLARVHRLLKLITVLQSGRPRSMAELIGERGVSRRTVFRDLAALEAAGIPCYYDPSRGYRIRESFFLPAINLTVPETLGLMMLGKLAATQRDKPLTSAALSAVYKLLTTVPEPVRSACGDIMDQVSVAPAAQVPGDHESAHYSTLQRCIDEQRACRLAYQGPGDDEATDTIFHPYALHFAARAWYVYGRSAIHREVRCLKLARIASLRRIEQSFTRPAGFSVDKAIAGAWQLIPEGKMYNVEVEFTPKVAMNVCEVRWHPTQETIRQDNGSCRMRFRVNGIGEIAWWICGYADQARVVRPAALRDRVQQMLARGAEQY